MNKFTTIKIDDSMINDYLFYRNLSINRKFASSKKKIKKIDHYQWWFKIQNKSQIYDLEIDLIECRFKIEFVN